MAEREREMREVLEQQQMSVFESLNEREERLRREKEREQAGEEVVNFTLLKPHPQFIYHTTLPGEDDSECM